MMSNTLSETPHTVRIVEAEAGAACIEHEPNEPAAILRGSGHDRSLPRQATIPERIGMSIDAQQILEKALALPAIDRAAIVESLLTSLNHPEVHIDEVWAEGAEKRIAVYDAGQMKAIPAEEVFKEFDHRDIVGEFI